MPFSQILDQAGSTFFLAHFMRVNVVMPKLRTGPLEIGPPMTPAECIQYLVISYMAEDTVAYHDMNDDMKVSKQELCRVLRSATPLQSENAC